MAARGLTSGRDDQVIRNLKVLAPSSFWRNTWLLAAGNIFRQREHLRSQVIDLLGDVDADSILATLLTPSAGLALDLLEDEVPGKARKFQRKLIKYALQVLDAPPTDKLERLAAAVRPLMTLDKEAREIVRQRVGQSLKTSDVRWISALLFLGWLSDLDSTLAWNRNLLLLTVRKLPQDARQDVAKLPPGYRPRSLTKLVPPAKPDGHGGVNYTEVIDTYLLDNPTLDTQTKNLRRRIRRMLPTAIVNHPGLGGDSDL